VGINMASVTLSKQIDISMMTDVLVIGGGPAGLCAAISSARNGCSTLLVEQNGYCGGMATAGMVGPMMTCYDSSGKIMLIQGLFKEIVERLVAAGGAIHPSEVPTASAFTSYIGPGHLHVTPFDAEKLKKLADDMLIESGVQILYHTVFVEPIMENQTVKGAILFSKSGFKAVGARVVIDCTGDADVVYRSGAPVLLGSDENYTMQPATLFFKIGNVDSDRVDAEIAANLDKFYRKDGVNYRSFHWRVTEARENGDWNLNRVSIGMFRSVKKDEWLINTSRIMDIDGTDAESLTQAELIGRRQVEQIFEFMKKYIPGCENAVLMVSAPHIGIRETRHIYGEVTLKVEDVLGGIVPEDSILVAANSIDIHGKFGPLSNQYITIDEGKWYGVSYGCLIPLNIEGLLAAGRCISAEPDASGAIRVMPPCMAMGQAAGVAAALSIKQCQIPRRLSVKILRDTLKAQGVFLG
jgi:hypothetical protein